MTHLSHELIPAFRFASSRSGWQAGTIRAQSPRSELRTSPLPFASSFKHGLVVELADTADSKSVARKGVGVRVAPRPLLIEPIY